MNLKCSMLNKSSQSHGYMLYDSMSMTFWTRQIKGTENRSVVGKQLAGRRGSDRKKGLGIILYPFCGGGNMHMLKLIEL